ncbi:MAG: hypothetical protein IJ757_09580 [Clostridiales bacterium]|nr:hypothetical protein [Clostridiales bacterium]
MEQEMQDIWQVLGIEPTEDIIAIKRAYTAKAHTMNPEDEPDRFRELHDAYRTALSVAKGEISIQTAPIGQDSEAKTRPVSAEEQTEPKKDEYDFGDVENLASSKDVTANAIIDEILELRQTNKLNSKQELVAIPDKMKFDLATVMFGKYRELVYVTGNIGMWYAFFDEPLITYCSKGRGFRSFILGAFPPGSKDRNKIEEIMEERGFKSNEAHYVESVPDDPARKKRDRIVIIVLVLFILVIIAAIVVFIVFSGMSRNEIILSLSAVGAGFLLSILMIPLNISFYGMRGGDQNGYHRNRSGNDKQSGMRMER